MSGYIILAVYVVGVIGGLMWAGWEQDLDGVVLALGWPAIALFFILTSPYWIMSRIKDRRRYSRHRRY